MSERALVYRAVCRDLKGPNWALVSIYDTGEREVTDTGVPFTSGEPPPSLPVGGAWKVQEPPWVPRLGELVNAKAPRAFTTPKPVLALGKDFVIVSRWDCEWKWTAPGGEDDLVVIGFEELVRVEPYRSTLSIAEAPFSLPFVRVTFPVELRTFCTFCCSSRMKCNILQDSRQEKCCEGCDH